MAWNRWRGAAMRPANDVFPRPQPPATPRGGRAQPRRTAPARGVAARDRIGGFA